MLRQRQGNITDDLTDTWGRKEYRKVWRRWKDTRRHSWGFDSQNYALGEAFCGFGGFVDAVRGGREQQLGPIWLEREALRRWTEHESRWVG